MYQPEGNNRSITSNKRKILLVSSALIKIIESKIQLPVRGKGKRKYGKVVRGKIF